MLTPIAIQASNEQSYKTDFSAGILIGHSPAGWLIEGALEAMRVGKSSMVK
jgi:hypothetical protein